eukprot:GEMP01055001.1.p1 GENE.GEMP01055001.1~~GEMP01055001.1.p1  ORF type:complete len:187 (+),score=35.22 GEMP01055001.1:171-731(+)
MDGDAKAVQKAKALHKADAAFAKGQLRLWEAKAKAYAKFAVQLAKAPPPFPPVDLAPDPADGLGAAGVPHPPPGAGVAAPIAGAPNVLRGYPYLAKAATYRRNPNAPPIHVASDGDVEGRMLKSRRISASTLAVAKVFTRTARDLHTGDPRTHYDPKATAVAAARGTHEICATLDARLQAEFGDDD